MANRYIPNTPEEKARMLAAIGLESVEDLFGPIPASLRLQRPLDLGEGESELEVSRRMADIARTGVTTSDKPSFLGAGIYDHYIPSIVSRITSISQFYTAYTPYQPEISQGTLMAIFEFQTLISRLTGMHMANASMYDGATAAAEAMLQAVRVSGRHGIIVLEGLHPQALAVMETYARFNGIEISLAKATEGQADPGLLKSMADSQTAAVFVQTPNFYGIPEDVAAIGKVAHDAGALLVGVSYHLQSSVVLSSFGESGCDIACGEAASLGLEQSWGGSTLGFMAVTQKLMRSIPGRVVGQSLDADGKRAFVLTLQAREQHIRRESATSNICTNQALNALAATVYVGAMGLEGLTEVVNQSASKASHLLRCLRSMDMDLAFHAPFIDEFAIVLNEPASQANARLAQEGIIGGLALGNLPAFAGREDADRLMLVAVTEKRTREEIEKFASVLGRARQ